MVGLVGWRLNFNWGWRSKIVYVDGPRLFMLTVGDSWIWRLKTLEVDGSSRGHELRTYVDRLPSIYEACHVSLFDWIMYRIEALLRLPCISHIYDTPLSPHFYNQNILSERHRHPCQSTPSNICTRQLYNRRLSVTQSGEYLLLLLFFSSLAFCAYILLDLHTRQSLLDPSVLGFVVNCRQCLVRRVINQ